MSWAKQIFIKMIRFALTYFIKKDVFYLSKNPACKLVRKVFFSTKFFEFIENRKSCLTSLLWIEDKAFY